MQSVQILCSGSDDRSVRLWRVVYDAYAGTAAYPFMRLDTQSTHILCLSSCYLDGAAAAAGCAGAASTGGSSAYRVSLSSSAASTASQSLSASLSSSSSSSRKDLTCGSIMLVAGTNVGMVYVWSMSCAQLWSKSDDANVPKIIHGCKTIPTNQFIDDGSHLHSLLHSSDRPVVQVAVHAEACTTNDSHASSSSAVSSAVARDQRIILLTSDVGAVVRLHISSTVEAPAEAEIAMNDLWRPRIITTTAVGDGHESRSVPLSTRRHQREQSLSYLSASERAAVTLVGETLYQSPVVSLEFQSQFIAKDFVLTESLASDLIVCTTANDIRLYTAKEMLQRGFVLQAAYDHIDESAKPMTTHVDEHRANRVEDTMPSSSHENDDDDNDDDDGLEEHVARVIEAAPAPPPPPRHMGITMIMTENANSLNSIGPKVHFAEDGDDEDDSAAAAAAAHPEEMPRTALRAIPQTMTSQPKLLDHQHHHNHHHRNHRTADDDVEARQRAPVPSALPKSPSSTAATTSASASSSSSSASASQQSGPSKSSAMMTKMKEQHVLTPSSSSSSSSSVKQSSAQYAVHSEMDELLEDAAALADQVNARVAPVSGTLAVPSMGSSQV